MKKYTVITGGGSGIGRALARCFAERDEPVLIIGRRKDKLIETAAAYPEKIEWLQGNVADESDRRILRDHVQSVGVRFLIHNAAILGPIKPVLTFTKDEWQEVLDINLTAPLFLSAMLIPLMQKGRILHISSGAAHYPLKSWGAYCVSKAGLLMLYRMLNEEMDSSRVVVGSLRPGIVNTEMQAHIRAADLEKFPHLARFHDFQRQQQLEAPETVADFAHWLLTRTSDESFAEKEWDIRDGKHA